MHKTYNPPRELSLWSESPAASGRLQPSTWGMNEGLL